MCSNPMKHRIPPQGGSSFWRLYMGAKSGRSCECVLWVEEGNTLHTRTYPGGGGMRKPMVEWALDTMLLLPLLLLIMLLLLLMMMMIMLLLLLLLIC